MKKNSLLTCCVLAVAIVSLGLSSSCTAPYDATGSYSGEWSFKDNESKIDNQTGNATTIIDCPLEMTLEQDVASVNGTIHVDYSCLTEISTWPPNINPPPPADVKVTGLMSDNGTLVIASFGCTTAACAFLALSGTAEGDKAEEGKKPMTRYSGTWVFAVGIAFVGNFGVTGDFEVTRE